MDDLNETGVQKIELGVSDFVAIMNQTLDFAIPEVIIVGELANYRVSRNKWVYFDLKDENSLLRFFGNVYQLPGPLEDGMILKVLAKPHLHNLYGFNLNVINIALSGEGTIKKAADLLTKKLEAEGLFDPARKRPIAYPPAKIGLVTAKNSAAHKDFVKILENRFKGLEIRLVDALVQGDDAPQQIVAAINNLNNQSDLVDVLVVIRGGGSKEDLMAFNNESVVRSVAASRIPTVVAIGHEIDVSLAELAAEVRASTPTHSAEILVPDAKDIKHQLESLAEAFDQDLKAKVALKKQYLHNLKSDLTQQLNNKISVAMSLLSQQQSIFEALNPDNVLARGYAVVRNNGKVIKSDSSIDPGSIIDVKLYKGNLTAKVLDKSIKGVSNG